MSGSTTKLLRKYCSLRDINFDWFKKQYRNLPTSADRAGLQKQIRHVLRMDGKL